MACEEKIRLMTDYYKATEEFAGIVTRLWREMGVLSKTGYERLGQSVDQARIASEDARLALERHISTHRC